ncbi:hypothetical protein HN832_00650 [archaeon]|jgi:deoxyribose-phosphate aldolase|nr:hypothetical protein [archaeon]MBT4373869.1 hypothetical protein [archaeon]MBT4532391.1 hypothetical protein [archaeon]MBT7001772.1 hypothetical protein [archaeon]MBT7281903.1 hypothetical protein [archaeon]
MVPCYPLVKIDEITIPQLASICDHTFLKTEDYYLEEAKELGISSVRLREERFGDFLRNTVSNVNKLPYAVCVRPRDLCLASGTTWPYIRLVSVVGFPEGFCPWEFKKGETELAAYLGADEIDMVLDYDSLKNKELKMGEVFAMRGIEKVSRCVHEKNLLTKLILETCELNPDQIKRACQMADELEVDFVKTSTGYGAYGARAEDVKIMRDNFSKGVKISGGVNPGNVKGLLYAASGREDGHIELDPMKIRIGEGSLLDKL